MAEASFEQARKAFEKFMASAQATAGTIEERGATVRAGAKEVGAKAVSYAEKNVQASLDYAQSLLKAKDLPEVMRLHSEYRAGPDARAGGAGQRNGPDRQPRRDGCGPAEKLSVFNARGSQARASMNLASSGTCITVMRHCTRNCIALHKIDMIGVFYVLAR